jgi:hypothetical protein
MKKIPRSVTGNRVTPIEMSMEIDSLTRDDRIQYPVRLLSLEGACKYLSCSGDLLEKLIAMGCFPVIRLGPDPAPGKRDRRKRWLDRYDLDYFVETKKDRVASTLSREGVNRG